MAITFRVNLETVNRTTHRTPYDIINQATLSDNFKSTRITWFPGLLRDNRELRHGDTFTESGKKAIYLRDNITSGAFAFLEVVSGTAL